MILYFGQLLADLVIGMNETSLNKLYNQEATRQILKTTWTFYPTPWIFASSEKWSMWLRQEFSGVLSKDTYSLIFY